MLRIIKKTTHSINRNSPNKHYKSIDTLNTQQLFYNIATNSYANNSNNRSSLWIAYTKTSGKFLPECKGKLPTEHLQIGRSSTKLGLTSQGQGKVPASKDFTEQPNQLLFPVRSTETHLLDVNWKT